MDDNKTSQVASQTEIPVNSPPLEKKPLFFSRLVKKPILAGIILIVIIVLVAVFLLPRELKNPLGDEFFTAYNASDYKKAENIAKELLKNDETNLDINLGLINAISAQGNLTGTELEALKNAQPYIDRALKTGSNNADVLISVGYAYEAAGDYSRAFEYYKKATELNPESADAWFHYGHVNEFLGNANESNSYYDKAFELNSSNPRVLITYGNKFASENKLEDAFNSYSKASKSPDADAYLKAETLTAASEIKMSQGAIDEALKLSDEAMLSNGNFSPALGARGFQLALNNNRSDGINLLRRAIDANPRITKNYLRLAQVLRADKQFIEAINVLKDAISKVSADNTIVNPKDAELRRGMYTYELAKTYSMSGSGLNVVSLLSDAIAINPNVLPILKRDFEVNGFFNEQLQYSGFNEIVNS